MNKHRKTARLIVVMMLFGVLFSSTAFAASPGVADNTYYNTGCLTNTETVGVFGLNIGTVVVMTPNTNVFYVGEDAEEMILQGNVHILAIPGVGSSSIGAAAFAKHIALIKNQPVAAIVVGLGDGSVYTEGPQGYYIGRPYNVAGMYYPEVASQKLVDLFAGGAEITLLVGHSKGNMDIANALYKMYLDGNQAWYENATFKTFGCGVNVPPGLASFKQYIGTLDTLGYTNTVSWANMTYVYGRYHTTNPYYAMTYMPIQLYL